MIKGNISCLVVLLCLALEVGVFSQTGRPRPEKKKAGSSTGTQGGGKTLIYNLDNEATGKIAANFQSAHTGQGKEGTWVVQEDATAPSQPKVLAQTSSDPTSYRFPMAILQEGSFKDLEVSVEFKPVSGKVDQAGGLVFRYQDQNNYYIVRANARENNVVLYKIQNGKRTDLPLRGAGRTYGMKTQVPSGQWSRLRVVAKGNLFEVYFNDAKLFEVEDATFKAAGKVGLWTKADSVTYFDDLTITTE